MLKSIRKNKLYCKTRYFSEKQIKQNVSEHFLIIVMENITWSALCFPDNLFFCQLINCTQRSILEDSVATEDINL